MSLLFEMPRTETAAYVRPVISRQPDERAAVCSDPELKLAEDFTRSLVGSDEVTPEVAEQAVVILRKLRGEARIRAVPTISSGQEGLIGMTWEDLHTHVNIQVFADRRLEFFAEDLDTGGRWFQETRWGDLPEGALQHLRRLA
jgi:hypothetical protein